MHAGLSTIALVLCLGVLALIVARIFKLPALIGYLAAGITWGRPGLRTLADNAATATLAVTRGDVPGMFSIGLEFSLSGCKPCSAWCSGWAARSCW